MSTLTLALLAGTGVSLVLAGMAHRRREWLLVPFWAGVALALSYLISVVFPTLMVIGGIGGGIAFAYHRRTRTAATVTRWSARSRRKHGVASSWDILRHTSWLSVHRRAASLRPSLVETSRWRRLTTATAQLAIPLCRTGLLRVWSSIEDVTLVFGRPRVGKSQWLIGRIIDAPGAVLTTSTRTDIYDQTQLLRQQHDRPLYVFNPTGLSDLPTTLNFDPLTGCGDPNAAYERATDLLSASPRGGPDHAPWAGQARRVLTALLHAAALGELTMQNIAEWVANPEKHSGAVLSLLRRSPSAAAYVPDAEQFLRTNDRTRSSITSTIMPVLGWLASPTACAAISGAQGFNVAEFLAGRGTVYLLGAEESQVAPLVAALTGLIAREARRIAARAPQGRLDPPLTLVLDECALISPVPLDSWTADMGGRGVHIIAAFQSRAQMVGKWGDAAARVILNNAGAVMLFALGADTDDLAHWSRLAGDRDEPSPNHDAQRRVTSHTTRRVPVVSPTQLTNLTPGRVVVFVRGMSPVMGRAEQAHKRRDVRRQAHLTRRAARAVTTTAEAFTAQAAEHAAPSSPIPAQRWAVDTQGVAQSTNGTHPSTGQTAQEAPDVTH